MSRIPNGSIQEIKELSIDSTSLIKPSNLSDNTTRDADFYRRIDNENS
jgi:hypothetical protein